MEASLNLTLKRGPSVWDEPQSAQSHWRVYGMAAGAAIAILGMRPRAKRPLLIGLALGAISTGLLGERVASGLVQGIRAFVADREALGDSLVDRASRDSFPASDPTQY